MMVSRSFAVGLEHSGYAIVLREQPETALPLRYPHDPSTIGLDIPELVTLESLQVPGIWQFLYGPNEARYGWLESALAKIAALSSGSDKIYAELALSQASNVSNKEPCIYNAPEGGIVIENRSEYGTLTLIIEDRMGVVVRSAADFRITAEFNITPHSINELLVRYVNELRLLMLPRRY